MEVLRYTRSNMGPDCSLNHKIFFQRPRDTSRPHYPGQGLAIWDQRTLLGDILPKRNGKEAKQFHTVSEIQVLLNDLDRQHNQKQPQPTLTIIHNGSLLEFQQTDNMGIFKLRANISRLP